MEIKRDNFRFNRIINPSNVIEESTLFYMEQNEIDDDDIVCGEQIEGGDNIIVLQNITEPYQGERYCYLKTNTIIGGDGHTKLITINKIIVDKNLINQSLFFNIFKILLQQEENEYNNRIMLTTRFNECFKNRVVDIANSISNRICEMYSFTSDLNPSFIIP